MFAKRLIKRIQQVSLALGAGCLLSMNAAAAVQTAGTLFVDLNASDASAGSGLWVNNGSLGDFVEVGDTVKETVNGATAVTFDGTEWYDGPVTPAGLEGNSDRTIEVWVYNPGPLRDEETILSWGHRGGPDNTNMSFNYGTNATWGAAGQWGGQGDMGWGLTGAPQPDQWHHLVYTYDGTTKSVYADGVLKNSEVDTGVNTHVGDLIKIGAQIEGNFIDHAHIADMSYGAIRVHDGALTQSQIVNNFVEDAANYNVVLPTPEQVTNMPAHRWSFNDGTANDSIGNLHGTVLGGATISGGQISLDGVDDYVNLSNGTSGNDIAALAAANGVVTVESWGTYDPNTGGWSRIVDMGDTNIDGLGNNYIIITPRSGPNTTRVSISDANPGFNNENFVDGAPSNVGQEIHIVAIFDDANDTVSLYINGAKVSETLMSISLNDVSDALGYFGRSLYPDPYLLGSLNEIRIYDVGLSDEQVLGNYLAGPDDLNFIPTPAAAPMGLLLLGAMGMKRRRRS